MDFLTKLMQRLMLSCKKATELVEKRTVAGLSPVEAVQMRLHMGACEVCRHYEHQSAVLDKAVAQLARQQQESPALDEQQKALIISRIEAEAEKK